MQNKKLMLIILFILSACHSEKNQYGNWSQYEEDGPSKRHSHSVIRNEHNGSYVGIVKTENGLSAVGITNGIINPETRIGIQFDERNNKIQYISISERSTQNNQTIDITTFLEKKDNVWKLREEKSIID
ncbi:hypothetical protein [Neisseria zalophi]|uniref:Uncharacterized protein n=1 Tax=Neisseria zalophi TaxID=640030 RepID=A0A5J6PRD4_9NEIS|nr:hypothetical protein [Neisseria zalophi]QEY25298.1 hypothetical protein D0T92_01240 [Neisseria zalophi]